MNRVARIVVAVILSVFGAAVDLAIADTYVVNSTADEVDANPGDGICATAGGACTLRAAIQTANAHVGADEITLPAGTFRLSLYGPGENLAATGDLDITDLNPLVITGAGRDATIIDGLSADRIFETVAPGPDVTIRDLTITGGDASGLPGGGILHSGPTILTVARVRFVGNYANAGGAIFQSGGDVVVTDCVFEQDSVNGVGGGIHKTGPGGLTATGSQFTGQTAANHGGAIYFAGSTAVALTSCTFTSCESGMSGGAAYVGNAPSLTIDGCIFDSCTGLLDGGAVFYNPVAGALTITQSQFLSNRGDNNGGGVFALINGSCAITGSRFESNWARAGGGGLFLTTPAGGLTVENTDFLGNTALTNMGGAIQAAIGGPFAMTSARVNDNSSTNGGGGVELLNSSSVDITRCTFARNTTTGGAGGGGAVLAGAGAADLTLSLFTGNLANMAMGGGVVCNVAGALTITDVTFSANEASGIGGRGGALVRNAGPASLTNATFSGNRAGNQGGAMFAAGATTLTNCTLAENSAPNGGGGLFTPGAPVTVRNTIIIASLTGGNCSGAAITSGDFNISSDATCPFTQPHDLMNTDPHLAPLADNGGGLPTYAILAPSPAIDAADPVVCPATDERGATRPQDGNGDGIAVCDIGAFEFVGDCNQNGLDDAAEVALGTAPDCNANGIPDACDIASGVLADTDLDGIPDICDTCTDTDGDGFGNPGFAANTCAVDNCPDVANPDQADADGDGVGDACTPAQPSACGCSPGLPFAMPLTLLGLAWMQRRGRARRS